MQVGRALSCPVPPHIAAAAEAWPVRTHYLLNGRSGRCIGNPGWMRENKGVPRVHSENFATPYRRPLDRLIGWQLQVRHDCDASLPGFGAVPALG